MTDAAQPFSAHARYAAHTARKLGLDFRSLDGADCYLFEIADGPRRAYFSTGANTPYALNSAHAAAIARDKAFAQTVLERAGAPTIPSRLFFVTDHHADQRAPGREPRDARAFAKQTSYPLFAKPLAGAQGELAEIIADEGQFERYLERAARRHYAILVQPVIDAPEHRVFVLEGRPLFAYEKCKPTRIADGRRPLGELAPASPETVTARDAQGVRYRREDIPSEGAVLTFEGAANRALGGAARNLTTEVPEDLAKCACDAADALDLKLCAVDVFATEERLVVIEVNSSPAIETLESEGRWDLIETIWTANIRAALK